MCRLVLLLVLVSGVFAALPAAAQEDPTIEFTSKMRVLYDSRQEEPYPRGIALDARLRFKTGTEGVKPPLVLSGRVLLPRGIVYNGGDYPSCTVETLRRDDGAGLKYCPKRSVVGKSSAPFIEESPTPRITYVNGGARRILALVTYYNPAFVQEPLVIHVKPLRHSRRWSYELTYTVPQVLRDIAGVPIPPPTSLGVRIGGQSYAQRYIEIDRRCPKRGFMDYRASIAYHYGPKISESAHHGRLSC